MSARRPVAHVAVLDDALRAEVDAALHQAGWETTRARTGVDLVRALSGLILGDEPGPGVDLVVVDDALPGCRGSTIAGGLRELGIAVPVVIIATHHIDDQVDRLDDPERGIYVLDPPLAPIGVSAIARACAAATGIASEGRSWDPSRVDRGPSRSATGGGSARA